MRMHKFLAAMLFCGACLGTIGPTARAGPAAGMVSLPYSVSDSGGNQWTIYQTGMLQQRGNQPVYGQGAMLCINGEPVQAGSNRVRLDDVTGELVLDGLSAAGMTVTRRILVKVDDAYVRYIDTVRNTTAQEQTLNLQLQSRVNFGLTSSQTISDPHKKDRVLAWVGQTQANRAAVELLAGRSAGNAFVPAWQQETNMLQSDMTVKVPAGKEVTFMHIHATAASLDAGAQMIDGWKDANLLKSIPLEIRKKLINFGSTLSYVDNAQVLRGDLLDIVELRGGDQLKGTLKESAYTLHTFYGAIELPADRIIGLINIGEYRPRQLLVTSDGQVFGGELAKQTIAMELSSGQVTQIPLSQISRLGYRERATEGDEGSNDQAGGASGDAAGNAGGNTAADEAAIHPTIFLRTGDRMDVLPPDGPIDFITRYGVLKLDPKAIQSLAFQSDENAVHTAYLTDGSHIAGLVAGGQFKMTLSGTGGATGGATGGGSGTTQPAGAVQSVTIPASSLLQWQMTDKTAEPDADAPILRLMNGDVFVGALSGQLKLDTLFDTISVDGSEIQSLTHAATGGDVQIQLWDQTRLSGSLQEPELDCTLLSGGSVKVPVALIEAYTQPQPQPSEMMVQQIKAVVTNLAADDWKQRDQAQNQLIAMGPMIAGVLKQLLPGAPPEAQQRLELVLKQFAEKKNTGGTGSAPGG